MNSDRKNTRPTMAANGTARDRASGPKSQETMLSGQLLARRKRSVLVQLIAHLAPFMKLLDTSSNVERSMNALREVYCCASRHHANNEVSDLVKQAVQGLFHYVDSSRARLSAHGFRIPVFIVVSLCENVVS
jgi:hypothetical protein